MSSTAQSISVSAVILARPKYQGVPTPIKSTQSMDEALEIIKKDVIQKIGNTTLFFRRAIRNLLRGAVPVRTAKLLDTMLNTLHIEYIAETLHVSALLPEGYPLVIENPKHSGQVGYGPKYTPTNVIANRRVIKETKKGAYYALNDPTAIGNLQAIFTELIFPLIRDYIPYFLHDYEIRIKLPPIPETATPSGQIPEFPESTGVGVQRVFSPGIYVPDFPRDTRGKMGTNIYLVVAFILKENLEELHARIMSERNARIKAWRKYTL